MPCKALERTLEAIKADDKYKDIEFINYDVERDTDGQVLAIANKVTSVPTTLLIDDNGSIVFKILGNAPRRDVENAIQVKLLAGIKQEDKKENEETT